MLVVMVVPLLYRDCARIADVALIKPDCSDTTLLYVRIGADMANGGWYLVALALAAVLGRLICWWWHQRICCMLRWH